MKTGKTVPKTKRKTTKKSRTGASVPKKLVRSQGGIKKFVELLQINQIELEHQNEELRITEEELEVSRNKYVNLFDFAPIPYFSLAPDGSIVSVNVNGSKMMGVDRRTLMGKSFGAFVAPEGKNTFAAFLHSVFTTSEKQSCKVPVINKEKQKFHVLVEGIVQEESSGGEPRCQIALIDQTEYKTLEEELHRVTRELNRWKTEGKKV